MNRRGFFKSLALLTGAASLSPHIFIPKFEPVKWKVASRILTRCTFEQFLIEMTPLYDAAIISEAIREDGGFWVWRQTSTRVVT